MHIPVFNDKVQEPNVMCVEPKRRNAQRHHRNPKVDEERRPEHRRHNNQAHSYARTSQPLEQNPERTDDGKTCVEGGRESLEF